MRRTLAELLGFGNPGDPLSSAEFALWGAYYSANGFDADRCEWASANAGAAAARALGSDVRPGDIVPSFSGPDPRVQRARIMAFFDGLTPDKFGGENGGRGKQRDRDRGADPECQRGQARKRLG